MIKAYLASLRLAVALVCVGVSLIIGGIWLGLIPDRSSLDQQRLEEKCNGVAIGSAALIRDQNWDGLSSVLQTLVDQDDELIAIEVEIDRRRFAVRSEIAEVEGVPANEAVTRVSPVRLDDTDYGTCKVQFRSAAVQGWLRIAEHPLVRLLAFFVVAGIGVYFVFVSGMMKTFEVTQVVPDRVRQALDTLAEGLLVMDERERIILANRSFSKVVGLSQEALIGKRAGSLPWVCSHSTTTRDFPWVRAIEELEPQTEQLMQYKLPDGSSRFFSINSSPIESPGSKLRGALATFRDVTDFEEHRAELEHMLALLRNSRDEISHKNRELEILAHQDALTGCMNRRALFDGFETLWREAKQNARPISCLMVDNDDFKQINDQHGHQVGDEVLRQVSAVLLETFPLPAMVCRYGGEEFCIVLEGVSLEEATELAEAARFQIEQLRLDGSSSSDLRTTVSIGVSALQFGATEPQDLINQADQCLYIAKGNGRNQVVAYDVSVEGMSVGQAAAGTFTEHDQAESTGLPFQAVTALVSALAYRDSETAEHSRRVADLCVRLASGILDQRSTYILEIGALLHDIGKIGVPDNVLLKPGPLTDEEWKLMRRHDRIGVEIASSTFNCEELSEIIRTHRGFYQQRESDSGLPDGKDIPIAARLLTIADSYDAMVSDRVYRKGRSHDEAIAELRRCAGTQFDPVLVEHFAKTITKRVAEEDQANDSIPKQTAMQIGLQIERLADALDARDVEGLQTLASRLGAMARYHRIESIAVAAEKIECDAAAENMQWINLLRDTQLLLNLCRATQNAFLSSEEEQEASSNA